ncbi:hypothetical protein JRQ81_008207, partial [Phrynocephalus forsythii]
YWIEVLYADTSAGYLHLLQKDVCTCSWLKTFPVKLHFLGLSMYFFHIYELKTVKSVIEKQIKAFDFQYSTENARKISSSMQFCLNFEFHQSARYLENLSISRVGSEDGERETKEGNGVPNQDAGIGLMGFLFGKTEWHRW